LSFLIEEASPPSSCLILFSKSLDSELSLAMDISAVCHQLTVGVEIRYGSRRRPPRPWWLSSQTLGGNKDSLSLELKILAQEHLKER